MRKELIRLAHSNKELRPHLLPLLKKNASSLLDYSDTMDKLVYRFLRNILWIAIGAEAYDTIETDIVSGDDLPGVIGFPHPVTKAYMELKYEREKLTLSRGRQEIWGLKDVNRATVRTLGLALGKALQRA